MASYERVANTLWHPENTNLRQPPLTDQLLADAEQQLGVTLPADLVSLLRTQNGGVIADEWDACPAGDDYVPFDYLCGIGQPDQMSMTLLDTPYLVEEWGLPSPVVLLCGEGHYWIALDYRQGGPSVVLIDNELEREEPLAPDFRSFVERLTASKSFLE